MEAIDVKSKSTSASPTLASMVAVAKTVSLLMNAPACQDTVARTVKPTLMTVLAALA